jgi:hypothetical protein
MNNTNGDKMVMAKKTVDLIAVPGSFRVVSNSTEDILYFMCSGWSPSRLYLTKMKVNSTGFTTLVH